LRLYKNFTTNYGTDCSVRCLSFIHLFVPGSLTHETDSLTQTYSQHTAEIPKHLAYYNL